VFANPTSECPTQCRIESESVPLQCRMFIPLPSKATPQVKTHQFTQNAVDSQDLPVYGDGSNIREWIYLKNSCRAVDLALREKVVGEVYTIGSHAEKTNLEGTEAMLDAVGADDD
jgi:dTDP-glucose 4,6-dehydratase (EC 4.2.1.46)